MSRPGLSTGPVSGDKCTVSDTMTGNQIHADKTCYIHVKVRCIGQEISAVQCHEVYGTISVTYQRKCLQAPKTEKLGKAAELVSVWKPGNNEVTYVRFLIGSHQSGHDDQRWMQNLVNTEQLNFAVLFLLCGIFVTKQPTAESTVCSRSTPARTWPVSSL